MDDWDVTIEVAVYVPVKIRVSADSAIEAIEKTQGLFAGHIAEAIKGKSKGWGGDVTLTSPFGETHVCKANMIVQTSGGEKAKKVKKS
jgi:hypothetical protein